MAKRSNFWIGRGSSCRVKHFGVGLPEVEGQRVRVQRIRADGGTVETVVMTGPARGATQLLNIDDFASCTKPRRR